MTPLWFHRILTIGDSGADVGVVQRKLGLAVTELYDVSLSIAVRGVQREVGLEAHGSVDEETAQAIGPLSTDSLVPDWYKGKALYPGEQGYEVVPDESWLRRFQGNHGLPPTGVIDEDTALLLGAAGVSHA